MSRLIDGKKVFLETVSIEQSNDHYAKVGSEGINEILGKILTYADMSFTDPEQRKAFKDSVKGAMWDWWHNYELFTDKESK